MRHAPIHRYWLAASLGLFLAASSTAVADAAQEARQEAEDREGFAKADANRDGKLTLEEALAIDPNQKELFRRLFTAIDADEDDVATFEEVRAFLKELRKAMKDSEEKFNAMDLNADGRLTIDEATAGKTDKDLTAVETDFKKADSNSDGFVDKAEFNGFIFRRLTEP